MWEPAGRRILHKLPTNIFMLRAIRRHRVQARSYSFITVVCDKAWSHPL
jgi:hypothetical protein